MRNKNFEITQESIEKVYELASEGKSRSAIANRLGITIEVLISYNGVLHKAIKAGRDVYYEEMNDRVEKALLHRALGYGFRETKTTEKDGKDGVEISTTVMEKQKAPNVQAQEFFLINHSRREKNNNWQSINAQTLVEDSEKVELLNKLAQHLRDNVEEPKEPKKPVRKIKSLNKVRKIK